MATHVSRLNPKPRNPRNLPYLIPIRQQGCGHVAALRDARSPSAGPLGRRDEVRDVRRRSLVECKPLVLSCKRPVLFWSQVRCMSQQITSAADE